MSTTARGLTEYLAESDVVLIRTRTAAGAALTTPIWSVVVDGGGFIRNGWGERSLWYRRAMRNGDVAFVDGATCYMVHLERVRGSVLDLVDHAYLAKYRGQPTDAVIADPARSFTLKVEPV